VASSLVDSPPAAPEAGNGQAQPQNGAPAPPTPPAGGANPVVARNSAKCGAPMLARQDWCLQCGAGAPGSLGTPGWRSAATVLGVVAVLVLGAAAAAVAALSKGSARPRVVTSTVAQVAPPTASTPLTASTTPTTTPPTTTTTSKLPLGAVKPPKIPLTAVTPKASERALTKTTPEAKTTPTTTTTPATTTPSGSGTSGESGNEESQQSAILLDTNAASTYNPYNYPSSWFGDPSLTIDGDPSTAWTAQVNPATAPVMAEGVLIDLKAKQKVAVLQLISSTPGMTVQVYGANGHTVPASITDPAWVPISRSAVVRKKRLRLPLRHSKRAFTYIALWISKAPQASIGTATTPGHVDVNEIELFPTR
jgi:hypothetical protein